jgi:hypothetical protein
MANGRSKGTVKKDLSRDPGGFVALPWSVLDSAAYQGLSHPAKALLLEFARQYRQTNNGRLLASKAHLASRGWRSSDVIARAKRELLEARLIFETFMGHRPNKASWYALTWYSLDWHPDFDPGVKESFRRGMYRDSTTSQRVQRRPPPSKHLETPKIDAPGPANGPKLATIAPSSGPPNEYSGPSGGPMSAVLANPSVPSHGHHLEKPSAHEGASKNKQMPATARNSAAAMWHAFRAKQSRSEAHGPEKVRKL